MAIITHASAARVSMPSSPSRIVSAPVLRMAAISGIRPFGDHSLRTPLESIWIQDGLSGRGSSCGTESGYCLGRGRLRDVSTRRGICCKIFLAESTLDAESHLAWGVESRTLACLLRRDTRNVRLCARLEGRRCRRLRPSRWRRRICDQTARRCAANIELQLIAFPMQTMLFMVSRGGFQVREQRASAHTSSAATRSLTAPLFRHSHDA